jgi:hypothetical protein
MVIDCFRGVSERGKEFDSARYSSGHPTLTEGGLPYVHRTSDNYNCSDRKSGSLSMKWITSTWAFFQVGSFIPSSRHLIPIHFSFVYNSTRNCHRAMFLFVPDVLIAALIGHSESVGITNYTVFFVETWRIAKFPRKDTKPGLVRLQYPHRYRLRNVII